MTAHLRTGRDCALALVCGCLMASCSPSEGPQTGSQTNWLTACRTDADCDDLRCLCGACTQSCSAESSCAELTGASCIPAEDVGAVALCGGESPSNPGLCLPRCNNAQCESGTACVAGVCTPIPDAAAHVAVDTSTEYQTLVGFGATVAFTDDQIVQHPEKEALLDAMFAESGVDVLRLRNCYEDDNEGDLAAVSEILGAATERLGRPPTTLMTSWSPPAELKANGSRDCAGDYATCTLSQLGDGSYDYAGFAAYWRASLEAYARAGIQPDYISIQNNPNWAPEESDALEACLFLPTEGTTTLSIDGSDVVVEYPGYAEALAAVIGELDGLASVPMIAAPEVSGFEVVSEYASSLDFSQLDAISHHMFGTDPAAVDDAALAALGELGREQQRPLLQTEMRADGLGTAVLMYYVLAVEGAAAYLQNDFVGTAYDPVEDTPSLISFEPEEFAIQDPYHAMRHYAIHTDPDWVRVSATSDADELLVTAWLSPDEDAVTVVVVNAGQTELDTEIELDEELSDALSSSEVTRTVFDGIERSAQLGALPPEGVVRVPGRSIVTVARWR